MKIILYFILFFFSTKLQYKNIIICSFLVQALKNEFENLHFPDWDIFEFITEKEGRRGPSKQECVQYYNQKLVFYFEISLEINNYMELTDNDIIICII